MSEPPAPFVVGVGRSGTTLLRLMLDAHSDLAIPGETHFLRHVAAAGPHANRAAVLAIVSQAPTWPNMALTDAELRAAFDAVEPFEAGAALRAFYQLYARRRGKHRWGDKTPPYRTCMTDIARLLPEARFIHMIRDGRDTAISYRGLWFGPGDDIEAQARFWVEQIAEARRLAARLEHYEEVRYETLVRDPAPVLRHLCDYLELRFEPTMLEYHRSAASRLAEYTRPFGPPATTPTDIGTFLAIHNRVKASPDPGRIGRWRTEMSGADRERFEAIAGNLLEELGYEVGR